MELEVGEVIVIVGAVVSAGASTVTLPEAPADEMGFPDASETTTPLIVTGMDPADALPEMLICISAATPDPMALIPPYATNLAPPDMALQKRLFPAAVSGTPAEQETYVSEEENIKSNCSELAAVDDGVNPTGMFTDAPGRPEADPTERAADCAIALTLRSVAKNKMATIILAAELKAQRQVVARVILFMFFRIMGNS